MFKPIFLLFILILLNSSFRDLFLTPIVTGVMFSRLG